jgi:hypothetical protein
MRRKFLIRGLNCENQYEALKGADALVLVTEWQEFREPDFNYMKNLMRTPVVFDGRNIYKPENLKGLVSSITHREKINFIHNLPFKFSRVDQIPDLVLIEPAVFEDKRGFFMETYSYKDFEKFGINEKFVQDNHSRSIKGVLRGLHFQIEPFAQSKLVRCIKGEILMWLLI